MKVAVLGNGLLGKEISKQSNWDNINRSTHQFDFIDVTSCYQYLINYDIIINCIAHTDTYDKAKEKHWQINYKAATRLSDWCKENNKKIVHISTDYVYANTKASGSEDKIPVHAENWYTYTKLLADGYIELKNENYLIIRCGHKPKPFPYELAYDDMLGNFDYVDNVAKNIIDLIKLKAEGIYNVGTEDYHSMYELALKTKNKTKSSKRRGWIPWDVRMDCSKFYKKIN